MPNPLLQGNPQALARIQPQRIQLEPLPKIRADLYGLEMNEQAHPHVRMFAGMGRTLVDHMILMARGQGMQAKAIAQHGENFDRLVAELQTMATAETPQGAEAARPAEPITPEVVPPDEVVPPPASPLVAGAPQLTVTPVKRGAKAKNGGTP